MHARVTVRGCVEMWKSGQHWQCKDCPLGPQRGARGHWMPSSAPRSFCQYTPGHQERKREAIQRRWAEYRAREAAVVRAHVERHLPRGRRVSDLSSEP